MSKFFDETQKAQDWALREGAARKLDVQQMLETVKENVRKADTVSNDLSHLRIGQAQKIRLPRSADSPVIFSGNEAGQIATESYRALRTRLLRMVSTQGLRSVVVSSAVPGEGKTLTSLNLALCCAQLQDMRVLVIDGDLRTRGLTGLLGHSPGIGLSEVLGGQATFGDAILSTEIPNLYVLGAGSTTVSPPELFAGDRWKEFIGWCSESFKLILVDSPPILPLADFELIAGVCDGVLVVVRARHTQREALRKASTHIDAKKLLGVVLNASDSETRNGYYYYRYSSNNNHQQ